MVWVQGMTNQRYANVASLSHQLLAVLVNLINYNSLFEGSVFKLGSKIEFECKAQLTVVLDPKFLNMGSKCTSTLSPH